MSKRRPSVMTRRRGVVLAGALSAWAAGSAALLLAARSSATDMTARGVAGLEGQLATAASVLGVVLLSWLAAAFVASVLDLTSPDVTGPNLTGPDSRAGAKRRYVPRAVRQLAALMLGLSLAAGTAGAAGATAVPANSFPPAPVSPAAEAAVEAAVEAPIGAQAVAAATWTPDRPAAPVSRALLPDVALVTAAPRLGAQISEEVAVRGGDTLWSIAARHLGPDAGADDVARAWPLWWQLNRGVIGDDPDLIVPGQILQAPSDPPT